MPVKQEYVVRTRNQETNPKRNEESCMQRKEWQCRERKMGHGVQSRRKLLHIDRNEDRVGNEKGRRGCRNSHSMTIGWKGNGSRDGEAVRAKEESSKDERTRTV